MNVRGESANRSHMRVLVGRVRSKKRDPRHAYPEVLTPVGVQLPRLGVPPLGPVRRPHSQSADIALSSPEVQNL